MNYKLHDQVSDLLSSAATCRLCQLIVSPPLSNFVGGRPDDRNSTSKIYVRFSFLHRIRPSGYLVRTRSLPVLAGHACSTKPLSSDHSPEAFELIRSWVDDCLLHHDACKTTVPGDVIDENVMPRLQKEFLILETLPVLILLN
ncbi:hypothetical protein V2W45_1447066 [Cenococcum geophilum]